jgi:hypothetical protein
MTAPAATPSSVAAATGRRPTDTVVEFEAGDGLPLTLIRPRGDRPPTRGPVLLVHGAGVRAELFRPPTQTTLVDVLLEEGYDVWLLNWRASIDFPPNQWTLDQAAAFDHPAAVKTVCEQTGSDTLQAFVHCQGSTSFVMSAAAGLLPQVRTIVANAVTFHPVIPQWARFKIERVSPVYAKLSSYLDPAWANGAARFGERALVAGVELVHRECNNGVCRMVSFTYGSGFPALWRHENIDAATHEWVKEEFGAVPLTFFAQMARCVRAGHLLSVEPTLGLPADFVAQPPQTSARFSFLAGERNRCFLAESQRRSHSWLDGLEPGRHSLHVFPGYSHLDVVFGNRASQDTYPAIVRELKQP